MRGAPMTETVLVTGATGFLGRQIVAALQTIGAAVATPERRFDLLDAAARRELVAATRPHICIHAAWTTRHGSFWTDPDNLDWVAASLDLVRAVAAAGGRRFVLVGSCAEYDWLRPTRAPWRETRLCRPASLYGAAKLAAWTVTAAYAGQAGLTAAEARVFLPIGRNEAPQRLVPSLIRGVLRGGAVATGPAELTRDIMDVRDAGEAIARLALSRAVGPVNIGTGRPVNLHELVRRIAGDAAHRIRLDARPARGGEPAWIVADPMLLRRATGFTPRFTLEATLADAVAFWRAELSETGATA
jgi:nucleoside-diphosphate-sugar epimerase